MEKLIVPRKLNQVSTSTRCQGDTHETMREGIRSKGMPKTFHTFIFSQ
jgi:hypothetical protein